MNATEIDFEISDGRTVIIRPLLPSDGDALADAVQRADPGDLRRRFMGTPPPIHNMLDLLRSGDGVHDSALGAFDPPGRLVGVAQFDRVDDRPLADVAVEVARDYQHGGLGRELLRRIAERAIATGITTFTVNCFADNNAVIHLLRSVGGAMPPSIDAGAAHTEIDLAGIVGARAGRDCPEAQHANR